MGSSSFYAYASNRFPIFLKGKQESSHPDCGLMRDDEKEENIAMSDSTITDNQRRRFIRVSLIGLTLAPAANLLLNRRAEARGSRAIKGFSTEVPNLPESDPQATALAYKEDAASVDVTKYKKVEGASCRNCLLYSGAEGDSWGPCAVFSYRIDPKLNRNYVVSAKGWCRSWALRST
ncbi:MAG: high-potential iron-sulfur protein [Methylococcaceae bacterium]